MIAPVYCNHLLPRKIQENQIPSQRDGTEKVYFSLFNRSVLKKKKRKEKISGFKCPKSDCWHIAAAMQNI